ncbi:MAG TPA: Fur family transcriptional regulator [Methanotrichaceae archaeon]|nr:Fur family transcriptional regulator [Methanotrichaceae archaeon]
MDDPQKLDASVIKALRGKGYKATPQRIAIGRFALRSKDHPTAQRIYGEVKRIYPTVSLATVYKTIQILKEVGLIHELNLSQGQTRFDPDTHPHIHLICLGCGSIMDWEEPMVSEIMAKVAAANFSATGQSFDVYGYCQSCERTAKSAASKAAT